MKSARSKTNARKGRPRPRLVVFTDSNDIDPLSVSPSAMIAEGITIEIERFGILVQATVLNGHWTSVDKAWEDALNIMPRPVWDDLARAQEAIRQFGAKLIIK